MFYLIKILYQKRMAIQALFTANRPRSIAVLYGIFFSILSLIISVFKVQLIVFRIASKIITLIMFLLKKKAFACYYYIVPSNYFPTAKITCMQNESNPTSVLPSVMTKWQHRPVKRHLKLQLIYIYMKGKLYVYVLWHFWGKLISWLFSNTC